MENTRAKAEALLATRLDAIDALSAARDKEAELRAQIRDAEAATAAAWTDATNAGWSDKELTRLGFSRPVKRRTRSTTRRPQRVPLAMDAPSDDTRQSNGPVTH